MNQAVPGTSDVPSVMPSKKPARPCDSCRKRKSRCEMLDGMSACVLCSFHHMECTFKETVQKRPRKKRRMSGSDQEVEGETSTTHVQSPQTIQQEITKKIRTEPRIGSYDDFKGHTLLRKTLGLQTHRYATYVGPTSLFSSVPLHAVPNDEMPLMGQSSLRAVSAVYSFLQHPDGSTLNYDQEITHLDAIETIVAPHGPALIHLYFRVVHPSFPILHKKVWLEKYARTHREFSPACLAAVYILALSFWSYSDELAIFEKPNVTKLERLALVALSESIHRPKLGMIQALLMLLHRPEGDSWALTSQLVGIGQEIGLHLDCSNWTIPSWERGLRKRLAWAMFMQDKWGALVHGRPSHIHMSEWLVKPLTEEDFPENSADEDDEDGSVEIDTGRVLFCEMVKLTKILSDILSTFYTLAEQSHAKRELREELQRAKPIQLRLKEWHEQVPNRLDMHCVKARKLSSSGSLHLAYYAVEISLHRCIVSSIPSDQDGELVQICRDAAKVRLVSAIECVSRLKPEHLQSFWYSPSYYNFALLSTFALLLMSTSPTADEAAFYREKLEAYRWTLKVSSKGCSIIERALMLVNASNTIVKTVQERQRISIEAEGPAIQIDVIEDQEHIQGKGNDFGNSDVHFGDGAGFDAFIDDGWADITYDNEDFRSDFGYGHGSHDFLSV